jgi:hypothetical protein
MAKLLFFMPTTENTKSDAPLRMTSQEGAESYDLLVSKDNPNDDGWKNICLNYEKARKVFMAGEYERMWILEHDILPPKDALKRMLEVAVTMDASAVTGLYAFRQEPLPNLFMWDGGVPVLGQLWTWKDVQKHWGERIQVTGGAQGCILLDRASMTGFEFTLTERRPPDWVLMQHLVAKRIKQIACLDVICGHERESGEIVWPDKESGFRIEKPKTFIQESADHLKRFKKRIKDLEP